ncbi:MAG: glycoside hydrolase family 15 protein [Phototrophicaceae bacterium]
MAYQAIEDYGVIGNMHTVALVGKNGSIDWFCPRKFDDMSIFAKILDDNIGGFFQIRPQTEATEKQFYWSNTNILITRFLCDDGVVEITDFMPVGISKELQKEHWLIRQVKLVRGQLPMRVTCQPAFNYARDNHQVTLSENGALFTSKTYNFSLSTDLTLEKQNDGIIADFMMSEGDSFVLSLSEAGNNATILAPLNWESANQLFNSTVTYWREWLAQCTYKGRWRDIVYRSALTMKLLTYEPTGAIVAAPTTSLPEDIGGIRNWDYRYCWIRDSAFTLYGFLRIGFTQEAANYMHWLQARIHENNSSDSPLNIMYTIDGEYDIPEIELEHLEGYRQSSPVRIGNGAADQLQLDIYGELMDSIYLYNKYGERVGHDFWVEIREVIDWVADNWQRHDKGIWEIRGIDQPFVYSKLMCWVALDRGLRLADKRSFPVPRTKWLKERDLIYEEIMTEGWNEDIQTFTQYYGGKTLDASNLLMGMVFFISPHDSRMESTLKATMKSPADGGLLTDGLVYRYNVEAGVDGLAGDEGTFNMCTFWLVEILARNGQPNKARLMFEKMLSYANHLGLYAEETGQRGEALGNFPQAFTHLSLISAAYNLDEVLDKGKMP